jgi:hypothetical protein
VDERALEPCSLNVADVELLLHFSSSTAHTLANDDNGGRIRKFWSSNVPQIGLTQHFILHLCFALSAYHLTHLRGLDSPTQQYLTLAKHHVSVGVAEFIQALSHMDNDTCGAIYLAAMLVCYCTFAAGPRSPDDLLVCNLNNDDPVSWLPLIHGVRSIRARFDSTVLFSGLMSPLGESTGPPTPLRPTYLRAGTPRIDWEDALTQLRSFLASSEGPGDEVCLEAFDEVSAIYQATYGKRDGSFNVGLESQFVFGWLYRLRDDYVVRLRHKQPAALVILAYYSLLLKTVEDGWFVLDWTEHILLRLRESVEEELSVWLKWPMEQAGLEWERPRITIQQVVVRDGKYRAALV